MPINFIHLCMYRVQVYDVLAKISGRYSIVSLNTLLFTTMDNLNHWLQESPLTCILDFQHADEANRNLHIFNGWTLCVATLLHVWSIFFPVIFNGWRVRCTRGHLILFDVFLI